MRLLYRLAACLLAGASLATWGAAHAQQKRTAIVGAEIFDATGAAPFTGVVVMRNGLIESVSKGGKAPAGADVINAKGLALIPGLHDVHTHYFSIDRGRYNASEVNYAYLSAGVTAVADFSTGPESVAAKRDWYATMPAPRVFFAGRISPSEAKIWDWGDPATAYWVNTPGAADLAVTDIKAHGFDIIKAFTDGWRYGGGQPDVASMDEPTLTALVKAAKARDLPVFTHTLTLERGKAALRAGVSVIAHALQDAPADTELLDLVKAGTTAYGPTLQTYEPVKPGAVAPPADAAFAARVARFQLALDNVKAMHRAGMMMVVGSDSGSSRNPHGPSTQREMELLVKAGLTPAEVLIAGTVNSAKVLRAANTGTIQPGGRADLVLVAGKPWADISDVRKVERTFIAGKTVYQRGKPKPAMAETPPAIPASPLIADFERPDRRTASGALVQIDLDRNGERSWEVLNIVPRIGEGHALLATAKMAQRPDPRAEIVIPLAKGAIQPVDARAFSGIGLDVRGAGDYTLVVMTPAGAWTKRFSAGADWSEQRIGFKELTGPATDIGWTGVDLLAIRLVIQRPAGTSTWLEVDNLSFY